MYINTLYTIQDLDQLEAIRAWTQVSGRRARLLEARLADTVTWSVAIEDFETVSNDRSQFEAEFGTAVERLTD